jgi:hypothetical protein
MQWWMKIRRKMPGMPSNKPAQVKKVTPDTGEDAENPDAVDNDGEKTDDASGKDDIKPAGSEESNPDAKPAKDKQGK